MGQKAGEGMVAVPSAWPVGETMSRMTGAAAARASYEALAAYLAESA